MKNTCPKCKANGKKTASEIIDISGGGVGCSYCDWKIYKPKPTPGPTRK